MTRDSSDITRRPKGDSSRAATPPVLDLVIPVYNEAAHLEASVRAVCRHLAGGRALNKVWSASDAQVLAYCDVDLSTDLSALLPLVAPLVSGHSHIAIGTRLSRSSRVVRGPKREFISRAYNFILRTSLAARFSDAQCGFKPIRADVARQLMPLVRDTDWFFDTELLVLAERAGLRIHEVPVDWVDDPDSRVDIVATATADLKGIARMGRELISGNLQLREIGEHLPLVGDSQTRGGTVRVHVRQEAPAPGSGKTSRQECCGS